APFRSPSLDSQKWKASESKTILRRNCALRRFAIVGSIYSWIASELVSLSSRNRMNLPVINRRQFLQASAAAVALSRKSASAQSTYGVEKYDRSKVRRVGLIGTGWYGKSDLFRLIQV